MHQPRRAAAKRRLLPAVPVLALVVAGLSVSGASGPVGAGNDAHPTYVPTAKDYYINYVDPKVENASAGAEAVGKGGAKVQDLAKEYGRKFTEGNPMAGRGLAKTEQEAVRTGKNPRQIRYKNADETRVAKLLTIPVEFNANANDDFTDVMVPQAVQDDPLTPDVNERDCVQGTV